MSSYTTVMVLFILLSILAIPRIGKHGAPPLQPTQPAYGPEHALVYDIATFDYARAQHELAAMPPNVVDLGCGTGYHVGHLPDAVGVDLSPSMVRRAKALYPSAKFVEGDATNRWLFPAESVPHISLLYYTVYYVEDKHLLFQNIKYWLRPGGLCLVHLSRKLNYGTKRLNHKCRVHADTMQEYFVLKRAHRYEHRFYFEPYAAVQAILEYCGFELVSCDAYPTDPDQDLLTLRKL